MLSVKISVYVMFVYCVQSHPFLVYSGSLGEQKLGGMMIATELERWLMMARGIAVKGPLKSGNSLPFRELQGLGTWVVGLAKGRKRGPKSFQQYPWYPE